MRSAGQQRRQRCAAIQGEHHRASRPARQRRAMPAAPRRPGPRGRHATHRTVRRTAPRSPGRRRGGSWRRPALHPGVAVAPAQAAQARTSTRGHRATPSSAPPCPGSAALRILGHQAFVQVAQHVAAGALPGSGAHRAWRVRGRCPFQLHGGEANAALEHSHSSRAGNRVMGPGYASSIAMLGQRPHIVFVEASHVSRKSGPMSSPSNVAESPITDHRELVEYLASGSRPREDWRIGTEHEKFGFRLDDLRPPTFDGERGIEALLHGLTRFGWTPVQEHGRTIAPAPRWRLGHARAGRPARTLRRAARTHPRNLPRNQRAPRRGQDGRAGTAARLPRHGLPAQVASRRDAVDAQGPLQDHARVHAQARRPRPRHDDPHLHGAGQPRLQQRSRHGEEVPRVAGAAADRHRAVRRLAVHRRQAQRLPVVPLAHLDRHRSGPHRHARLRVRGWFRLRALRRLPARRADVLLLPRRRVRRRQRQVVPQVPARRARRACPARCRRCATGPTT
jgi:hypothetical protein